ncbi:MAG: hypothetical protein AAFR54_10345, partial [Planctomycetota bacterium]
FWERYENALQGYTYLAPRAPVPADVGRATLPAVDVPAPRGAAERPHSGRAGAATGVPNARSDD